jgi:hypothetical protein
MFLLPPSGWKSNLKERGQWAFIRPDWRLWETI